MGPKCEFILFFYTYYTTNQEEIQVWCLMALWCIKYIGGGFKWNKEA